MSKSTPRRKTFSAILHVGHQFRRVSLPPDASPATIDEIAATLAKALTDLYAIDATTLPNTQGKA